MATMPGEPAQASRRTLEVHFKLFGTDGVSLQSLELSKALGARGWRVLACASDVPAHAEGLMLPELSYQSSEAVELRKRIFSASEGVCIGVGGGQPRRGDHRPCRADPTTGRRVRGRPADPIVAHSQPHVSAVQPAGHTGFLQPRSGTAGHRLPPAAPRHLLGRSQRQEFPDAVPTNRGIDGSDHVSVAAQRPPRAHQPAGRRGVACQEGHCRHRRSRRVRLR